MKPHIRKSPWSGRWICMDPYGLRANVAMTPHLAYMAWWNEVNL